MNDFRGRRRELGVLRSLFDRPEPVLVRLFGPTGVGKTALLRRALVDYDCVHHTVQPLPEAAQRAALARELGLEPTDEPPRWDALFERFDEGRSGGGRSRILVLDDAHRLLDARARVVGPLSSWLRNTASRGGPPRHAVLSGGLWDEPSASSGDDVTVQTLELRPLTLRGAHPFLPGGSSTDKIVSYAVFGGLPRHLRMLDPAGSLGTNLRRLLLDKDGPLARAGIERLERELQTPPRYAAILSALAPGDGDWATVRGSVPDVTRGGQVAPYLKTLKRIGMVEVSRSLDARPAGRNRRYRVVDGFDAFWFGHILPHLGSIEVGSGPELLGAVRTGLDGHVASVLPAICRQYLTHDATERLPANARECGGLWGSGYDIPVAGLFASGGAFYGMSAWSSEPTTALLDELDRQIRETRYGFGREQRMRILFGKGPFTLELERRAAQRHDTVLIGADALVGSEE
jgi:AAA+ ATPase superfamily predicted ATPase